MHKTPIIQIKKESIRLKYVEIWMNLRNYENKILSHKINLIQFMELFSKNRLQNIIYVLR